MRPAVSVGDEFDRLRVAAFAGRNPRSLKTWECVCRCGGLAYVGEPALRSGRTRSCGCIVVENMRRMNAARNAQKKGPAAANRAGPV